MRRLVGWCCCWLEALAPSEARRYGYACYRVPAGGTGFRFIPGRYTEPRASSQPLEALALSDDILSARATLSCYCSRVAPAPFDVSGTGRWISVFAAWGSTALSVRSSPFSCLAKSPDSSIAVRSRGATLVVNRSDGAPQWRRATHTEIICGPRLRKGSERWRKRRRRNQ